MGKIKLTERLLGLFALGWLLLSFPLFSIWDRDALVLGWPLLPAAAFVISLLLTVALALLMEGRQADNAETAPDPQPGPPTLPEP